MDNDDAVEKKRRKEERRKKKKAKREKERQQQLQRQQQQTVASSKDDIPKAKTLDDLRQRDRAIDKVIEHLGQTSLFDIPGKEDKEIRVQLSDLDGLMRVGLSCTFTVKLMDSWEDTDKRFANFLDFVEELRLVYTELRDDNKSEAEYKFPAKKSKQLTLDGLRQKYQGVDKVIKALSSCTLFDDGNSRKIEVGIQDLANLLKAGKGGSNCLVIINVYEKAKRRFSSFTLLVAAVQNEGKDIRKKHRAAKKAEKKAQTIRLQQQEARVASLEEKKEAELGRSQKTTSGFETDRTYDRKQKDFTSSNYAGFENNPKKRGGFFPEVGRNQTGAATYR